MRLLMKDTAYRDFFQPSNDSSAEKISYPWSCGNCAGVSVSLIMFGTQHLDCKGGRYKSGGHTIKNWKRTF